MTHKIGDMIAAKRKERGLTQEDVCLGICETATLSKIENGKHFPTKARLDAILQRLDLDASRYQGYISDADFEQQELQYEVVQRLANGELEETQKALACLREQARENDTVLQQFILFYETALGQNGIGPFAGYTEDQLLKEQLRALRMTAPRIDLEEINKSLLTIQEIIILDNIANLYCNLGKKREALYLYEQLLRYTRKHCLLMQDAARIIPIITHNYANNLLSINNFEESLEIAELGCEFCVRYGRTKLLGQLLYFKAYSLLEMDLRDRRDEAVENLQEAYYILRIFNNNNFALEIKAEALEKWNIILN